MMIGPAPMISMLSRSARLGMALGLVFPHQCDEMLKQGFEIVRPRARLRVPLKAERGQGLVPHALQRAVKQRAMRGQQRIRQALLGYGKAVILAADQDPAIRQRLHRMIRAMMAEFHLDGFGAEREREQLMAETDAKDRQPLADDLGNGGDRIITGVRVARSVG